MKVNIRLKVVTVVTAGVAATALLAACGGSSPSTVSANCKPAHDGVKTVNGGKLTIGVIDIPPFSSFNSGKPEGIDVSITKKIAQ